MTYLSAWSHVYQNIYFLFKTNKKAHIQKQKAKESKEIRKITETKEEKKVVIVNNICGKSIGVQ